MSPQKTGPTCFFTWFQTRTRGLTAWFAARASVCFIQLSNDAGTFSRRRTSPAHFHFENLTGPTSLWFLFALQVQLGRRCLMFCITFFLASFAADVSRNLRRCRYIQRMCLRLSTTPATQSFPVSQTSCVRAGSAWSHPARLFTPT